MEEKLKKVGLLEDKNVVKIGFKGSYVYYNRNSELQYNKTKLKNKLSTNRNSVEDNNSFLIDCLEYCFLQKNGDYEDQHEYRILIVQYSEQNVFPEKGIKLHYPTSDSNWKSKIIKNKDTCPHKKHLFHFFDFFEQVLYHFLHLFMIQRHCKGKPRSVHKTKKNPQA